MNFPEIKRTTSDNADFQKLVSFLDLDLATRDGKEHEFYAQFNSSAGIQHSIVAYVNGEPSGIGALRPVNSTTVEIKRMFVKLEYRGYGLAKQILAELEVWAGEMNFNTCILETGKKQPEAISLYRNSGYQFIPNYGPYQATENSVCMKKAIG